MSIIKKILVLCLLVTSFSCDDGDLEVLEFQFEENIQKCGEYLLFRANKQNTEVLVLSFDKNLLGVNLGEKKYSTSQVSVVYRLFDKPIKSNYFCQNIPPSTPKILKNLKASSKTQIIITTTEKKGQKGVYEYKIVLKNLLFEDDNHFYFDTFDFGVFVK
ncbi:MAG: hypothetical protein KGV44_02340 [Flavobacteriaceae bacterium]|nr:hypothetical protein [Flavobacteriaceae bacterium]